MGTNSSDSVSSVGWYRRRGDGDTPPLSKVSTLSLISFFLPRIVKIGNRLARERYGKNIQIAAGILVRY